MIDKQVYRISHHKVQADSRVDDLRKKNTCLISRAFVNWKEKNNLIKWAISPTIYFKRAFRLISSLGESRQYPPICSEIIFEIIPKISSLKLACVIEIQVSI
ncbi:MAG: hypothetical protein MPJ50_18980 [Pirellulales bacterium]|nr:hypothetical protein [Pirellulales bacterium]